MDMIAKDVGYESEYKLIQKFLSGAIHSTPLTIKNGPLVHGFFLIDCSWHFAFRILGAYAEYKRVDLDEVETYLIESARKNVFDFS